MIAKSLLKKGLDGTTLKLIALILMVVDHIHYFFEFTGMVPIWFTMLGRLSAPLFLFCFVEGFVHTHDRRRYFLRIWAIGGCMGCVTYLMIYQGLLRRPDGFYPLNGIFLDFIILCIILQGIDWFWQKKHILGAAAIAAPLIWGLLVLMLDFIPGLRQPLLFLSHSFLPAWYCITDGGWTYLFGGVLLYMHREDRILQLSSWAVWTFFTRFIMVWWSLREQPGFDFSQMFTDYFQWMSVGAVLLMALYNGRRGTGHKKLFYWFYPAHVYLLYAISWVVCSVTG